MNEARIFAILILSSYAALGLCTVLAVKGYVASSPQFRNFIVTSGLGTLVKRKSDRFYEASNFRSVFDQGTDIRKARMDAHDIVEIHTNQQTVPAGEVVRRNGLAKINNNRTKDEDRMYSERLFSVLTEMDKRSCVYRLLCEIGADPRSFGIMGYKIHNYVRSVPPVTWNSATYSYREAFQAGFGNGKGLCSQHYPSCPYNLNKVMKFVGVFFKAEINTFTQ